MSKANDRQVAGDHYLKVPGEQHWDRLVRLKGLEKARAYFTGNITAYVEWYEDKNGVQDLLKAMHYLEKLIELEYAAAAAKQLADENDPTGMLHYRENDDKAGPVCDRGLRAVTTSRPQDVKCPRCKGYLEELLGKDPATTAFNPGD